MANRGKVLPAPKPSQKKPKKQTPAPMPGKKKTHGTPMQDY